MESLIFCFIFVLYRLAMVPQVFTRSFINAYLITLLSPHALPLGHPGFYSRHSLLLDHPSLHSGHSMIDHSHHFFNRVSACNFFSGFTVILIDIWLFFFTIYFMYFISSSMLLSVRFCAIALIKFNLVKYLAYIKVNIHIPFTPILVSPIYIGYII